MKVKVPVEIHTSKEVSAASHNFVIEAPEVGIHISESVSSEPKTISPGPTRTGKYFFYCSKQLPLL